MNYFDLIGALLSLTSTLLFAKERTSAWPFGIGACMINFLLYFDKGLFGDAILQIIYSVISIYGWYQWLYGANNKTPLKIRHATPYEVCRYLLVGMTASTLIGHYLAQFTHSTMPYLDAITTVFSLVGQWMISKKIIESWLVWFFVDAIYVFLYIQKAIPFHTILLMLYLGIAISGFIRWARLLDSSPLTKQKVELV